MTPNEALNLWVLLYSVKQGCFHVEQLRDTLESGLRTFATKNGNDYVPIFIHPDMEACSRFRQKIAPTNPHNDLT